MIFTHPTPNTWSQILRLRHTSKLCFRIGCFPGHLPKHCKYGKPGLIAVAPFEPRKDSDATQVYADGINPHYSACPNAWKEHTHTNLMSKPL